MTRKLLVDTDGGTDDALALALLAASGRAPDYVTTVFGNVSLAQATDNILATLSVLDVNAPVHAGADRPLLGEAINATEFHGEDGLGGAPRPSRIASIVSHNGVGFLIETLRDAVKADAPIDILALGPLTNLALAFRSEPRLIAGIGTLFIMGGTVWGRGNVTGAAEFNILADPEAAGVVLGEALDTVLVPWEPCIDAAIAGADLDALFSRAGAGPRRDFLEALVNQHRRVSIAYGEGDRLAPADPLAAAVLLDRAIATGSVKAGVAVECGGRYARGATILDLPGKWGLPPLETVETVDAARFQALFEGAIERLCSATD
ncbi:nucleoside hydrolase [Kaistia dalseonensis]|uniref:Purine nucleosidase/non-specific riboncleoside hydrolase n=1 Tax=Kaistia dalseonensis TaxID=410840 RepID=A0ABU0HAQ6_9HYPH|nr:nucleoside hydrolase [Kaistia dalseonensis]MCX5496777.1 nucleoside hydrolase [Kaistia dalseonensis]MDQ0439402.1 purine nucleosidase/non-specific riboncleoside hydrolase [Kaistia dalseonensis]